VKLPFIAEYEKLVQWPTLAELQKVSPGKRGKPVELGRGAIGVTYKAFEVDLLCPVMLKVISERYLSDESARLRFLSETRAAASVRHPNIASVYFKQEKSVKGNPEIKSSYLSIL
jgi:serine/threonine protein kinase